MLYVFSDVDVVYHRPFLFFTLLSCHGLLAGHVGLYTYIYFIGPPIPTVYRLYT